MGELIRELEKLDKSRTILIGDDDKYGRNDLCIASIIRKYQGFDDDTEYYYVISTGLHREGTLQY